MDDFRARLSVVTQGHVADIIRMEKNQVEGPGTDENTIVTSSENYQPGTPRSIHDLYHIKETIGAGSVGWVRRAVRKSDKTECAVKTLLTDDTEMTDIAKTEYTLVKALDHPYIVKMIDFLDFSKCKGGVHIVMEYIQGVPLEKYVAEYGEEEVISPMCELDNLELLLKAGKTDGIMSSSSVKGHESCDQKSQLDSGKKTELASSADRAHDKSIPDTIKSNETICSTKTPGICETPAPKVSPNHSKRYSVTPSPERGVRHCLKNSKKHLGTKQTNIFHLDREISRPIAYRGKNDSQYALDDFDIVEYSKKILGQNKKDDKALSTTSSCENSNRRKKKMSESQARRFFIQILDALLYLHSKKILHRDLTLKNIMIIPSSNKLKIIDFNFAIQGVLRKWITPAGTKHFTAPEVEYKGRYIEGKIDVYCAGICLYYMLTSYMPSDGMKISERVKMINRKYIIGEERSATGLDSSPMPTSVNNCSTANTDIVSGMSVSPCEDPMNSTTGSFDFVRRTMTNNSVDLIKRMKCKRHVSNFTLPGSAANVAARTPFSVSPMDRLSDLHGSKSFEAFNDPTPSDVSAVPFPESSDVRSNKLVIPNPIFRTLSVPQDADPKLLERQDSHSIDSAFRPRHCKAAKIIFPFLLWKNISEEAKDLTRWCVQRDPANRATVRGAIAHPWVMQICNESSGPHFGLGGIITSVNEEGMEGRSDESAFNRIDNPFGLDTALGLTSHESLIGTNSLELRPNLTVVERLESSHSSCPSSNVDTGVETLDHHDISHVYGLDEFNTGKDSTELQCNSEIVSESDQLPEISLPSVASTKQLDMRDNISTDKTLALQGDNKTQLKVTISAENNYFFDVLPSIYGSRELKDGRMNIAVPFSGRRPRAKSKDNFEPATCTGCGKTTYDTSTRREDSPYWYRKFSDWSHSHMTTSSCVNIPQLNSEKFFSYQGGNFDLVLWKLRRQNVLNRRARLRNQANGKDKGGEVGDKFPSNFMLSPDTNLLSRLMQQRVHSSYPTTRSWQMDAHNRQGMSDSRLSSPPSTHTPPVTIPSPSMFCSSNDGASILSDDMNRRIRMRLLNNISNHLSPNEKTSPLMRVPCSCKIGDNSFHERATSDLVRTREPSEFGDEDDLRSKTQKRSSDDLKISSSDRDDEKDSSNPGYSNRKQKVVKSQIFNWVAAEDNKEDELVKTKDTKEKAYLKMTNLYIIRKLRRILYQLGMRSDRWFGLLKRRPKSFFVPKNTGWVRSICVLAKFPLMTEHLHKMKTLMVWRLWQYLNAKMSLKGAFVSTKHRCTSRKILKLKSLHLASSSARSFFPFTWGPDTLDSGGVNYQKRLEYLKQRNNLLYEYSSTSSDSSIFDNELEGSLDSIEPQISNLSIDNR